MPGLLPRALYIFVAAMTLVACGGAGGTASRAETTSPRPASTAPAGATATVQPRTTAAAAAASTPSSVGAIAGLSFDYAAFPQSTTPEGYYVLGQPDAPVLIQYYSDFL